MSVSGIEKMVCDDIAKRQQFGINKYNTTVLDNPLSLYEWLKHAYEECLDQAIYLRRAMFEIQAQDMAALRKVVDKWVDQDAQDNNGDNG